MGPHLFWLLFLCLGSYGLADDETVSDTLERALIGLGHFMHTGEHPGYLEPALKSFPLTHIFRQDADTSNLNTTIVCLLCEVVVNALIAQRRKGMTSLQVAAEASYFCVILNIEDQRVCDGVIDSNVDIFAYMVDNNKRLTGERICAVVFQNLECRGVRQFEWTIDIPDGKTTDKQKPTGKDVFNILHISDVHYNPYYTPGKTSKCGEPLCCQDDQPDGTDETDTCGYWGDYTNADMPLYTINEVMDRANTSDIDFVYYTGDTINHRVWSTSVANNTRDISTIYGTFNKYFKTPVFFALGNHEPHPLNAFSSSGVTDKSLSTQWLYDLVASEFGQWLSKDANTTIEKGGYYSISPRKGFRIISLNSNVCYVVNWWLINDDKDPYDQLAWLVETLTEAEKNGESVHILMHIPTGSTECLRVWSREYSRIVERFANTIVGQFHGHTHKDVLLLYYSLSDPTKPINVAWNGASVMSDKSNPSFKLYKIDEKTYDILDYEEWTFNLTLANENPKKDLEWYKLYSFKDAYGVDTLEPVKIDDLVQKMAKNNSLILQYYNYIYRNSDYVTNNPCDKTCQKNLLCDITTAYRNQTAQCERFSKLYDENNK